MKLSAEDLALFFRLQKSLMLYANEQLDVLPRVRTEAALERIISTPDGLFRNGGRALGARTAVARHRIRKRSGGLDITHP